jgi:hypothetical protein
MSPPQNAIKNEPDFGESSHLHSFLPMDFLAKHSDTFMQVLAFKFFQFVATNKLVLVFDKPSVSSGAYLTLSAVHLEGALLRKALALLANTGLS